MSGPHRQFFRTQRPDQGLRDDPEAYCHEDVALLGAVAEMLRSANPKVGEAFEEWIGQVEALSRHPVGDDMAVEQDIDHLQMELRRQWIGFAGSVAANELKSPAFNRLPVMPFNTSHRYEYERILGPREVENDLRATATKVPGWDADITLMGNGMAAIGAAITALRHYRQQYQRQDGAPLELDMFGGYFETLRLLEYLDSGDLMCQRFEDQATLLERFSTGRSDILLIEPVAFDWKQTVFDPVDFHRALTSRPVERPWILLLDTTLLGPVFRLDEWLGSLQGREPLLVMDVRSALKFDQIGLEFCNAGVIHTLTPLALDKDRYPVAGRVRKTLAMMRKVLGTGLSFADVTVLDAPWIFHPRWTLRHTRAVLDNNRELALTMPKAGGLFSAVNHPGLSHQNGLCWAESPFVVMEFRREEDVEENHRFLMAVIAHEIRERGLVCSQGTSFGFRHHRCEVVRGRYGYRYPDGEPRGFFKVAMGARNGPSAEQFMALIHKLAEFPDFGALRAAYQGVDPRREYAAFPDVRSLRALR